MDIHHSSHFESRTIGVYDLNGKGSSNITSRGLHGYSLVSFLTGQSGQSTVLLLNIKKVPVSSLFVCFCILYTLEQWRTTEFNQCNAEF